MGRKNKKGYKRKGGRKKPSLKMQILRYLLAFLLVSLGGAGYLSAENNTEPEKETQDILTESMESVFGEGGYHAGTEEAGHENSKYADNILSPLEDIHIPEVKDTLEVHFIDAGQGDATLVISGNEAMLIDAGENDQGIKIQNYLQKQGVGSEISLKYCIGTHPDSDHIGGMDVILNKFGIGGIFLSNYTKDTRTYEDVLNAVEYYSVDRIIPQVGATYGLGDAIFTIVAPNRDDYGEANDGSIGILLQHGQNRFLFLGDAEEKAEKDILSNGIDITNINLYKVSHHGSSSSSTEELLEWITPEYAVISVGEDNDYGHPHAEVLNRLRSRNVKVFRTDEQGSIIAESDGQTLTFNCAPSETWQAGE